MKLRYAKYDFIPIAELLEEDTEKSKKLKTISKKETEYISFLGPIESFFACFYYYDDPELKDSDVEKALRKLRRNLDKGIDFFENSFEKEFAGAVSETLQINRERGTYITIHEFKLIINYILWCIDNRKWMGDPRGYLNWLCNFFNLFDEEEKKEFDEFYNSLGDRTGIKKSRLDMMKMEKNENTENFELPASEDISSHMESKMFSDEELKKDSEEKKSNQF